MKGRARRFRQEVEMFAAAGDNGGTAEGNITESQNDKVKRRTTHRNRLMERKRKKGRNKDKVLMIDLVKM